MDPILYWNDVALEANRVAHTTQADKGALGPTLSSRALAIIHLAMHDAFAGVLNNPAELPAYLPGLPVAPAGADVNAAVSAAAYETLFALHPSQKLFFDQKLSMAGLTGSGVNSGSAYGQMVAKRILDERKNDDDASDAGYHPSLERGHHRVDPDNPEQGFHAPFYGRSTKLFATTTRYELDAPPALGTPEYNKALVDVRGNGIAQELMGTLPTSITNRRNVDETVIGLYWAYDGASEIGTPPRLYNQIVRVVAIHKENTPAQNARLFTLVNVAMADSGVLAWEQKYKWDVWRPVVGIREHDVSMGPQGTPTNNINNQCDPLWLPLGAPRSNTLRKNVTPNFPAYPSGHATFGAAAFQITRLFYNDANEGSDDLFDGLYFVSEELNGKTTDNKGAIRPRHTRNFPKGLWEMILENGFSRVYLGVHWLYDAFALGANNKPDLSQNIGGVPLGMNIAEDIFTNSNASGWMSGAAGPAV